MRRPLIDLRSTLRQLKSSPGYVLIAIAILALGIGATTAIYTLLDQALLRALPVRNPDRLVQLNGSGAFNGHTHSYGGDESDYFSWPMYRHLRDQNQVFSGMLRQRKRMSASNGATIRSSWMPNWTLAIISTCWG